MTSARAVRAALPRARPAPWLCGWAALSLAAVIAPRLATITVVKLWFDLTALVLASVVLAVGRRTCSRVCRVEHLAWLLPSSERENWRREVAAILHAVEHDPRQRRRQALRFVSAAPSAAWSCWRIKLQRRGPREP